MAALHERTSTHVVNEHSRRLRLTSLIPWQREKFGTETFRRNGTLKWPFNEAVLRDPNINIISSSNEDEPGITIKSYNTDIDFVIRSPAEGRLITFDLPDKTSTAILLTRDPPLLVIMSNLSSVVTREQVLRANKPIDPALLMNVREGEAIGTYGKDAERGLLLQVAYRPRSPTKSARNWELINPLSLLPLP